MKKYFLIVLIIFLSSFSTIRTQTITSTTTGGHWNTGTTWVGGTVPGENNDVIINGPIIIGYQTCNNLTINNNGSVTDEPSAGRTLTIKGNLTNYGRVFTTPGYAGVELSIQGHLYNYGILESRSIVFSGGAIQNITSNQVIKVSRIDKSPDGSIIAQSNIEIDSVTYVNLSNDILNMGNYKLTKYCRTNIESTNIIEGGTVFSNGELDISGRFGSNLDGNFVLVGNRPMRFTGGNVIENNLVVGTGKIIEDECCAGRTIYVRGNLTNNGTIRNAPGQSGLVVNVEGNVINNGEFSSRLIFSGSGDQSISGTNIFSNSNISKSPNGTITALSNITFDSTTTVDIQGDILNMGNYKLIKYCPEDIEWGTIIYGGTIFSDGELDISGRMGSNLDGNYTLVGNRPMRFTGNNELFGTMTVAEGKIIEEECCAGREVYIKGTLVNNGTMRHGPGQGGLTVKAEGNIFNHGTFTSRIQFIGSDYQSIGGSAMYSSTGIWKNPNGIINASSDLVFDSTTAIDLASDELRMGDFKLTKLSQTNLESGNHIFNGRINSTGEIDITGRLNSEIVGDFILTGKGNMRIGDVSFTGTATIAEGKVVSDEASGGRTLTMNGTLVNYGSLVTTPGHAGIYLSVLGGDYYGYGKTELRSFSLSTEGSDRFIYGFINNPVTLLKTQDAGRILVDGYLGVPKGLTLRYGLNLNVPFGSELSVAGGYNYWEDSYITNEGEYSLTRYIYSNGFFDPDGQVKASLQLYDRGEVDSLTITHNKNRSHPSVSSSVKSWWSISGKKNINPYSVTLYYDESLLNGNSEEYLDAYHSKDNGLTWKRISNPINTTRDVDNNKITIGTRDMPIADGYGDIILSSGFVTNTVSVSHAVTGRSQVRIGVPPFFPPNRFTITYWNNNPFTTDRIAIVLNTNSGVLMESLITKSIATGEEVTIPSDSLNYNGFKGEIILIAEPLAPYEVRSFDVICSAAAGLGKSTELITFTSVLLWTAGAVLSEYVSNTIVEGCYEMWRPVRHDESLYDASKKAVSNSLNKAVNLENGLKGIGKSAAEEVVKKTGRAVAWPVFLAQDIYDCLGNTIKGMKDYVNGNFDKQEKELTKVTSWDPNEKEGPAGFGDNGYMSVSAPMTYTIFFENKKEAAAPAYRVLIVDTLDQNIYDVNTVEFGPMSHSMGTASRNGNILTWDFIAIELPPNQTPPEGEGWVRFTVKPKDFLPTGTEIKNKATITFDVNEPITTNLHVNTLDYDAPQTNISNLEQVGNNINLVWSAQDGDGSGIKKSIVYMSAGEGPYTTVAVTEGNHAQVPITNEVFYKFYVLSEDNVGNSEKEPQDIREILTDVDEKTELPNNFILYQNYPNPFNPITQIKYVIPILPETSQRSGILVELKIYDVLGREIKTLIQKEQSPGIYTVEFDGSRLASGVYFYKLQAGSYSAVKKLLLMK